MLLGYFLVVCLLLTPKQNAPNMQSLAVYSVSGTVLNSISGEPIPDAEVSLVAQAPGAEPLVVFADSSGRFNFIGLVAGRYTVRARRRSFAAQSYLQNGPHYSAVVVGPEFDTSNIDLKLLPEGAITGHVYSASGELVRNAQVDVFSKESANSNGSQGFRNRVQTDDEGHYHVGRLVPGTYYVAVSAQPWYARHQPKAMNAKSQADGSNQIAVNQELGSPDPRLDVTYAVTFFSNASDVSDAQPIEISAGEVQTADVTLTPLPARHVILNIPANPNQCPNISIQSGLSASFGDLFVQAYQIRPGVWDVSGIPPGNVTVTVRTLDQEQGSQHVQSIVLGTEPEVSLSPPSSGVGVRGILNGEGGFQLRGSQIVLRGNLGGQTAAAVAPDGTFECGEKLDPGTYSITVNNPAIHYMTHLAATGAKVIGRTIEIGSQDVQLTLTVALANARLFGFALRDGKHARGMIVELLPEGAERGLFQIRSYQSDGSFVFQNVVPGRYTLIALDGVWNSDWSEAEFLDKFAAGGQAISIESGAEMKTDVSVQTVAAPQAVYQ